MLFDTTTSALVKFVLHVTKGILQNKYPIKFFFGFAIIIIRLNEQRKYLKHVKKIETIRNDQFICITVGINNKYVLSYRKWIHNDTET